MKQVLQMSRDANDCVSTTHDALQRAQGVNALTRREPRSIALHALFTFNTKR